MPVSWAEYFQTVRNFKDFSRQRKESAERSLSFSALQSLCFNSSEGEPMPWAR